MLFRSKDESNNYGLIYIDSNKSKINTKQKVPKSIQNTKKDVIVQDSIPVAKEVCIIPPDEITLLRQENEKLKLENERLKEMLKSINQTLTLALHNQ